MGEVDVTKIDKSVGLIGYGAVGAVVGRSLLAGDIAGMSLTGVFDPAGKAPAHLLVPGLSELIAGADVIVEAAGPVALRSVVRPVLDAGRTLVALSLGAFLSEDLYPVLGEAKSGTLILSTGALGGIDMVRAVGLTGSAVTVRLTSRKKPRSLIQPWMTADHQQRLTELRGSDPAELIFSGTPMDAVRLFPANLNVAAALAIAVGDPDAVTVLLIADPATELTTHEVLVESDFGTSSFTISNRPDPGNPGTSAITPWSVIRCLHDLSPRADTRYC